MRDVRAKAAVVFMTHRWDRLMHLKVERLRAEIGDVADVCILMQKSNAVDRLVRESPSLKGLVTVFDPAILPSQLGYPYSLRNSMLPGSVHFPVLYFFGTRKEFDHVFLIENDVDFSGNWGSLVAETLKQSPDLASVHLFSFSDKPDWFWWKHCRPAEADRQWAMDTRNLRRSFNPIYCLSRFAAERIDAAHRAGWQCHQEIILPTICARHGGKIIDFRDLGEFYLGSEQDHHPGTPLDEISTVRWRPPVRPEEFITRSTGKTLFHPVKDAWYFDGSRIVSVISAPEYPLSNVVLPQASALQS